MTRLRRWLAMPRRERATLTRAALTLTLSRLLLATAGLDRTRRLLTRVRVTRDDAPRALALARATLTAARHVPFATTCLDRAVALWWLLSRERIGGVLRIGVRRDDARLAAHAWVEHAGEVLLDEEAAHFAAFDAAILAPK